MSTVMQEVQAGSAVRVLAKAESAAALAPAIGKAPPPSLEAGRALVRVESAAVNPSDVKAALGLMPQAVWPRTPGRDFAGTVVAGPQEWVGRRVWGSGGDLGITRDGSHATWLSLPQAALQEMPEKLGFDEAGSIGVPFVTAYEGYRRSGMPRPGQVVAVMGANGKVGQAAVQLAAQAGARVIAVQRRPGPYAGHACAPVEVIDASREDVAARLRELTGGRGVDLVYNTVGSPYFQAANQAMAKRATQIFISTVERPVPFDIFTFYRGMHTYVGVDSLAMDCIEAAAHLRELRAGFEQGALRAFPIEKEAVYPLSDALAAYRAVIGGTDLRVVLRPQEAS
ncbi:Phthiocerol synthesis polyketide synthase type I PpsC [Pigmentiphaga humi]|uniref:Phthiocerol synthesis polyketide synthase type I PpsC n=1 Tax=Pigmentiphaga humi TaxID=2478468 RepID=A0A3P4B3G9_9BURK|nr:zinc-binding alcohol dehydrogenase family protein [Pigmentiphaga humi]VCU69695.1 Phthiocerol synthesis polyketide synthase type I PpsC [Pigmentiphaga humi]